MAGGDAALCFYRVLQLGGSPMGAADYQQRLRAALKTTEAVVRRPLGEDEKAALLRSAPPYAPGFDAKSVFHELEEKRLAELVPPTPWQPLPTVDVAPQAGAQVWTLEGLERLAAAAGTRAVDMKRMGSTSLTKERTLFLTADQGYVEKRADWSSTSWTVYERKPAVDRLYGVAGGSEDGALERLLAATGGLSLGDGQTLYQSGGQLYVREARGEQVTWWQLEARGRPLVVRS